MEAILISIKHKWCELIFSGEKTVEVRKIAPKLKPPFKAYVYETKDATEAPWVDEDGHFIWKGQVVGEFVCDKVEENTPYYSQMFEAFIYPCFECGNDCLSLEELQKYGNGDTLRGLHITEPKRYDTPKELWEFTPWCEKSRIVYDNLELCCDCPKAVFDEDGAWLGCRVTRAPQSWMYVEEIEDDVRRI